MKILVLGADGFVGRNLLEDLGQAFDCYGSTRRKERLSAEKKLVLFNLEAEETWQALAALHPDCIINCIVSGGVKKVEDVKEAIDTNYLQTIHFFDFLSKYLPDVYLIHLGTAFEYNLRKGGLTESTECRPRTYYGISKLLTSHYLLDSGVLKNFTIIRPFNLFGPHDKEEKIIPHLISAQRDKTPILLSEGLQVRDYFFVKDLSRIVAHLFKKGFHKPTVINAGSGEPVVLKDVAKTIANCLPGYDASLWQWGKLPYREGEGKAFYNASFLLKERGFSFTPFEQAIQKTVAYYCSIKEKAC